MVILLAACRPEPSPPPAGSSPGATTTQVGSLSDEVRLDGTQCCSALGSVGLGDGHVALLTSRPSGLVVAPDPVAAGQLPEGVGSCVNFAGLGDVDGDGVGEIGCGHFGGIERAAGFVAVEIRSATDPSVIGSAFTDPGFDWDSGGIYSVSGPGDVDGDDLADLVVDNNHTTWVIPGPLLPGALPERASMQLPGRPPSIPASGAGDWDGDGVADLAMGGTAVLSGFETGDVDPLAASFARLDGPAVALGPGDVDGDGRDDLLVLDGYDAVLALGPLAGDIDVASLPGRIATEKLVSSWAFAGDVDGDGYGDMVLGSPRDEPLPGVALYFGPLDGGRTWSEPDRHLTGVAPLSKAGLAVAALGDADGDGYDDFAVAEPEIGVGTVDDDGAVYVVLGGPR